jgi:hypothetical protein
MLVSIRQVTLRSQSRRAISKRRAVPTTRPWCMASESQFVTRFLGRRASLRSERRITSGRLRSRHRNGSGTKQVAGDHPIKRPPGEAAGEPFGRRETHEAFGKPSRHPRILKILTRTILVHTGRSARATIWGCSRFAGGDNRCELIFPSEPGAAWYPGKAYPLLRAFDLESALRHANDQPPACVSLRRRRRRDVDRRARNGNCGEPKNAVDTNRLEPIRFRTRGKQEKLVSHPMMKVSTGHALFCVGCFG